MGKGGVSRDMWSGLVTCNPADEVVHAHLLAQRERFFSGDLPLSVPQCVALIICETQGLAGCVILK